MASIFAYIKHVQVAPDRPFTDNTIPNQPVTHLSIAVLSDQDCLHVTKENGILTLLLNRPHVLNAIDLDMAQALREELKRAAVDTSVRIVVITGNGRAFCSGGDLKFALAANPDQPGDSFQALTSILHESIEIINHMAKPVIAAINGPAAGAGLFLALACDIRVMSETAYLKASNTSYGLSLPAGGTYILPRLAGIGKALEIIMLDRAIPAREAHSIGLVTMLVDNTVFASQVKALAEELALKAVHTLGEVKQLMNESYRRNLKEQLLAEQAAIVKSANHGEGREGLAAFVQKRVPEFANIHA